MSAEPVEFLHGVMRDVWVPEWEPLEKLLDSDELCASFMWMSDVQLSDGTILNAYKHIDTRRYFHLNSDADTFYYAGEETYARLDPVVAIKAVFRDWERLAATESERAAVRAAIRRARQRRS